MIEDSQRLMKFLINQIIDGNVKPMGDVVFYTTPNAGDFIKKMMTMVMDIGSKL